MFPTNAFAKQYCCNGNLFGILAVCLGINIDRAAASAATMWLLTELRKPLLLRRKWSELYRMAQKNVGIICTIVHSKCCFNRVRYTDSHKMPFSWLTCISVMWLIFLAIFRHSEPLISFNFTDKLEMNMDCLKFQVEYPRETFRILFGWSFSRNICST